VKPNNHLGTFILGVVLIALIVSIQQGILTPLEEAAGFDISILIYPLVVLLLTTVVAKLTSIVLRRYFEQAAKHVKVVDKTRFTLFAQLTNMLIWIVGLAVSGSFIPALRNLSVSLFAGAGVLAIVIGFATQKTLGNLVSGVMIATYQPYRIGDKIKFGEEYGEVEDITLRHTTIKTWDNRRIVVPNSKMDEEVINNFTIKDAKILGWFDIGISYDSDIDLAREVMLDEVHAHPFYLDARSAAEVLAEEEPTWVRVVGTGDSSVQLRLYFWAADQPTAFKMKTQLLERIKKRFDKEGVEIPYPYRTIVQKKELPKPKKGKKSVKK
jgi:small conductance mechanosensitive channel